MEKQQATGAAITLGSSAIVQSGAAVGAMAFPLIGAVGVVAVRQFVTALALGVAVRPTVRGLSRAQWLPVIAQAVTFGVMNLAVYAAIERIGLGLAITLEFLGPLAVAVVGSRRVLDCLAALVAGAGVVVLAKPGANSDLIGIGLALLAAAAWAAYILLNRTLGQRFQGLQGTALAALLSATLWVPIAAFWFATHWPSTHGLLLAGACGLLTSVVAYSADLLALRRISPAMFGTLDSANPVWAALVGFALLGQEMARHEVVGMLVIVTANLVVTAVPSRPVSRRVDASDEQPAYRGRPLGSHQPTGSRRLGSRRPVESRCA